ncbi:Haloalkane dehalogenase [Paraburkholderia domus]|uniref:Haloalkane dehalogenase n=1 Tax=Paraburkholderia domus TaxID=2793075 RepID=A0A9N8MMZ1_9BURK|nr:Haloalkane dehalogenase [Paraburkholderia domus]CAE6800335.1 Haloalkane dehalogenase [Paraburkholderia domus]CAE6833486.1 Haloalkane dehalogenase [Paraburkholderia domus]CAE6837996.1 Haloalkane dehalogenase [Paraburkholderia domus]CAE6863715.1 Haloalkane dehalogenase [Paraburkholderia domus]
MTSTRTGMRYHSIEIDGLDIFYREAGPRDAPVILLLHGFPSSSRMYETLMPLLARDYRLIAPDYQTNVERYPLSSRNPASEAVIDRDIGHTGCPAMRNRTIARAADQLFECSVGGGKPVLVE